VIRSGGTAVAAVRIGRELFDGDQVELHYVAGRPRSAAPLFRLTAGRHPPLAHGSTVVDPVGWPKESVTGEVDVVHATGLVARPGHRWSSRSHDLALLDHPEQYTATAPA
jgi:hypothetical protein